MIGRGPTSSGTRPLPRPHDQPRPGFRVHVQPLPNAHKTLYFLCSLSPFLFPSPVLRYSFNSLSIGMRLSSLTLSDLNDSVLVGSLCVCHFWVVNFESFIDDRVGSGDQ